MMEIGTIKAVHIYTHQRLYVTAELELNLKGVKYTFGGYDVFLSGMHGGESSDPPYLGRFLFRCMQVCRVDNWDELKSSKVLVEIQHGKVVAIADISGDNWFNPAKEFGIMDLEKEQMESTFRDNSKP
ncbi:hypothetical protein J2Y45_005884 [Dyadobacter sp. BE34]|uniref:Uncharacterized protein n=1 Tax=Dyadobacter fermentans TaxID=94254 RepID=A0ABU1R5I6_9BACT|nr:MULTISPECIES: hypothetical protein [Dyadobacter]MDR6808672.1 hypothetical protein [Dyadobacter fermentans]MDR7046415.1 hypothetical protein [Dyadobacter sp. BE242]MDR7200728.1 hypothetical protein [Dyadobacter sp. BE34]MDR7218688.1 hypothetical protein [Dyadobacter sp. BE31]MDR7266618.1 hypothetical protein [Dyadobacter sp. BE32]